MTKPHRIAVQSGSNSFSVVDPRTGHESRRVYTPSDERVQGIVNLDNNSYAVTTAKEYGRTTTTTYNQYGNVIGQNSTGWNYSNTSPSDAAKGGEGLGELISLLTPGELGSQKINSLLLIPIAYVLFHLYMEPLYQYFDIHLKAPWVLIQNAVSIACTLGPLWLLQILFDRFVAWRVYNEVCNTGSYSAGTYVFFTIQMALMSFIVWLNYCFYPETTGPILKFIGGLIALPFKIFS